MHSLAYVIVCDNKIVQSPSETYFVVGQQLQRNVRSCDAIVYVSSETSHFNSRTELWIYSNSATRHDQINM